MNTENQNQTNNQDTLEQDRNPVPVLSPEPAAAPAPGTAAADQPELTTDSSDSSDSTPTTDQPEPRLSADPSSIALASVEAPQLSAPLATALPNEEDQAKQEGQKEAKEENPELETRALQPQSTPVPATDSSDLSEPSDPSDRAPLPDEPFADPANSLNLEPETQSSDLPHSSPISGPPRGPYRNRIGKVANLPPDILEWVNLQLFDRVPYGDILEALELKGHGHITQQNLTNWKTGGGYEDWLRLYLAHQERHAHSESVCTWVSRSRGRLDEAALLLVSSQLLNLVGDFDLGLLKEHFKKDPQAYLRLIHALTRLNKARQAHSKNAQTSLVNKPTSGGSELDLLPESERGLTEETLKKITTAIKLF